MRTEGLDEVMLVLGRLRLYSEQLAQPADMFSDLSPVNWENISAIPKRSGMGTHSSSQRDNARGMRKDDHRPETHCLDPARPSLDEQVRPVLQIPEAFAAAGRKEGGGVRLVDCPRKEGGEMV
jgi:hypothetical protein